MMMSLKLIITTLSLITSSSFSQQYTFDVGTFELSSTATLKEDDERFFVTCKGAVFDTIYKIESGTIEKVESWNDCIQYGDSCSKHTKEVDCEIRVASLIPDYIFKRNQFMLSHTIAEGDKHMFVRLSFGPQHFFLFYYDNNNNIQYSYAPGTSKKFIVSSSNYQNSTLIWEDALKFIMQAFSKGAIGEFFGIICDVLADFAKKYPSDDMYKIYSSYVYNMMQIRKIQLIEDDASLNLRNALKFKLFRDLHGLRNFVQSSLPHPSLEMLFRKRWRETETPSYQRRVNLVGKSSKKSRDVMLSRIHLSLSFFPFEIFTHLPEFCGYISGQIVRTGTWEAEKTYRILSLMKEATASSSRDHVVFLDVGANLGWYTTSVAAQGINVIAIEPSSLNTDLLQASLSRNGIESFVDLHKVALTDPIEKMRMKQDNNGACLVTGKAPGLMANEGNFVLVTNSSRCDGYEFDDYTFTPRIKSIEFAVLDDLISDEFDIHVMKLDIEGYEPKVLRGARRILTSSKPPCYIIIEWNSIFLDMAGETNILDGVNELIDLGYECYYESMDGVSGVKKYGLDADFAFKDGNDYEFRWPRGRCVD